MLTLDFQLAPELENVRKLMTKYASVPIALADACRVRMTELAPRAAVITGDGDFRVTGATGRQAISVVMPQD